MYNWSKFTAGEDVFSLFEKTGLAGVDGRGFGFSTDYVRFSVGFIPVPPDQLEALARAGFHLTAPTS